MPGRSVTVASGWPLIWPSLRSTVTPGKFPTCWFDPVSWLNRVVLPQFWLPASAKLTGLPSGMGPPPARGCAGSSPSAGCAVLPVAAFLRGQLCASWMSRTSMRAASSRRRVSSYPRRRISIGSPMGAYFIMVTSIPGVRPMSRMC